ncbi:hypothetical protein ATCC90586_008428 [Pythium insidiosum]|nr:hypothetical protein ATCC90586_008428 [Pythium insidiosum]
MSSSRRQIRYEEYAVHGSTADDGDVLPPAHSKPAAPPRHSAAASHRANDAYMDAFDAAHDDLMQRHGQKAMPRMAAEETKIPTSAKQHVVRDLETAAAAAVSASEAAGRSPGDLTGAWLQGPRSPDGTVHNVSAQPLLCMSVSRDHREIVVGSSDHALYTIPLSGGSSRGGSRGRTLYSKKFGHAEWVTSAAFLADGRILSGGMDSKLCLWDATGVKCEDLVGHSGSVSLVSVVSPEVAVSASYDKTVRLWNVSRKATSRQREAGVVKVGAAPILALSAFAASMQAVTGDRDGAVQVVDLADSKVVRKIPSAHKGHTTSVLASRVDAGAWAFTGGQDGAVKAWDLRQKAAAPVHVAEVHVDRKSGKAGAVGFLAEPEDDSNVLLSAGADGSVQVLDKRASLRALFSFREHLDFIYALHVQGQLCFSGAGNGMLHVHDWKTGKLLYGLGANRAAVRAIATTPTQLIAAGDDGGVIVYDMNY